MIAIVKDITPVDVNMLGRRNQSALGVRKVFRGESFHAIFDLTAGVESGSAAKDPGHPLMRPPVLIAVAALLAVCGIGMGLWLGMSRSGSEGAGLAPAELPLAEPGAEQAAVPVATFPRWDRAPAGMAELDLSSAELDEPPPPAPGEKKEPPTPVAGQVAPRDAAIDASAFACP